MVKYFNFDFASRRRQGSGLVWLRRWLVVLGGCLLASLALAQSLEIIELKHRTAEDVIPILQPLLESGGALSGTDYQLFIRASATNVRQLRQVLAELDRAQRQLWVSVRRATRQTIERETAAASIAIGSWRRLWRSQ